MAAATSAPAWASGYGELLRFGGEGTAAKPKGHAFELQEETHAFGVDQEGAEAGSIYVGDEKEELSEEFRIQKYSSTGAFEGGVILQPNEVGKKELPAGTEAVDDLEGIAVAPQEERIYALVTYQRGLTDKVDPSVAAAGVLYAFKTKPEMNSKTGKLELVPASGTNEEGVLASSETLAVGSEIVGQALLKPAGIAYDPKTKEVLILGEQDGGAAGMHVALDRVTNQGKLSKTYVDPNAEAEPSSPVVSAGGRVYFENEDRIQEIAPSFESAPTTVFRFAEPGGFLQGPFKGELLTFGDETLEGGGLAIYPEGATEGRLIAFTQLYEMEEDGDIGQSGEENDAAVSFKYVEGGGEQVTVSESGWTGGVAGPGDGGPGGKPKPCEIGFEGAYPEVAGGPENTVLVLAPSTEEVIKFGEGGKGCPTAKVLGGVEALLDGKPVAEPTTTTKVTLAAKVLDANVLSVTWNFGDGDKETVQVAPGEQTQTAEVQHKFAKGGKLKVEATIHTDDLASPELTVSTEITVDEPPNVTTNPSNQTKKAGETATFEAAAESIPAPTTVEWEVSTGEGKPFTPITKGIESKTVGDVTSSKLTVAEVSHAENDYKYQARFKNVAAPEGVLSTAGTLDIERVAGAPEITHSPTNVSVIEGGSASFDATATGDPTPTIQWEFSTNGGASWSDVAGATSDTLTVTGTTTSESGREYRATFTNTVDSSVETATTTAATLTVTAKGKESVPPSSPPPPPPPPPSPPPPGGGVLNNKEIVLPAAKVASASLTVSFSGAVVIKVSCPSGVTTCTGTVTLRTLKAVIARVATRAEQAKAKAAILTLASGSFAVSGGQVKAITLHLSAAARKLLARSHVLAARATVLAHDPAGSSHTTQTNVTLRPAKGKSHH